jgi:hypothetical protein
MSADDVCEIINGLNLYAFAVDTLQWDLFDKVFTPDVQADYLGHGWTDLESWKHDFDVQHRALETSQHTVTNHQVVVDGDRATATSYAHARLIRTVPEGGDNFWECGAWYDDVLVRTPAGWRISKRVCRVNWWTGNPRVSAPRPGGSFSGREPTLMRDVAEAGELRYLDAVRSS